MHVTDQSRCQPSMQAAVFLMCTQGYVDASPQAVFEATVLGLEDQPSWNPTVKESKVSEL